MTRNNGFYYIVGYGGKIDIPTIDMITSEKTIVGNLVGTYAELVELMALADRGLVKLHTREYKLSAANDALHDLHNGQSQREGGADPMTDDRDIPSATRSPAGRSRGARQGARRAWSRDRS